jgi:hypothetical protein
MALTQDDFVTAVVKLNDLTRLQVIKWQPCDPIAKTWGIGQDLAKQSFEATHEDRRLRITQFGAITNLLTGSEVHRYVLDVRDQEGNIVFQFPEVAGLADLFRSIQTQKACHLSVYQDTPEWREREA